MGVIDENGCAVAAYRRELHPPWYGIEGVQDRKYPIRSFTTRDYKACRDEHILGLEPSDQPQTQPDGTASKRVADRLPGFVEPFIQNCQIAVTATADQKQVLPPPPRDFGDCARSVRRQVDDN